MVPLKGKWETKRIKIGYNRKKKVLKFAIN